MNTLSNGIGDLCWGVGITTLVGGLDVVCSLLFILVFLRLCFDCSFSIGKGFVAATVVLERGRLDGRNAPGLMLD